MRTQTQSPVLAATNLAGAVDAVQEAAAEGSGLAYREALLELATSAAIELDRIEHADDAPAEPAGQLAFC